MYRSFGRNHSGRKQRKCLKFFAITLICLAFAYVFSEIIKEENSEESFLKFFGRNIVLEDEDFSPKEAIYKVEEKMNSEMGMLPMERTFYNVSGDLQFTPPEKLIYEWEFVKPENVFGIEDLCENGTGVTMPENLPKHIQEIYKKGWKDHEFNKYLSDLISFHRILPDFRSEYCKAAVAGYRKKLPKTSVIIIYNNEAWSTLLRSVHSVLDRSPDHLIEEIILVDDFSDMGEFMKV
jgi:hypothetical protein